MNTRTVIYKALNPADRTPGFAGFVEETTPTGTHRNLGWHPTRAAAETAAATLKGETS
jgi:hypothetical protein